MNNFLDLYQAGAVKRWHTKLTIKDQDLAAHQWGVAMILMHIYPEAPAYLIKAALTHDLHESVSGDAPYPFKRTYPEVGALYDKQADEFAVTNGLPTAMNLEEEHILKWCDMFELLLWCFREKRLGNQDVEKTIGVAIFALDTMGPPTEAAMSIFNEVLYGN